jgi:hypothetical protein
MKADRSANGFIFNHEFIIGIWILAKSLFPVRWQALNEAGIVRRDKLNLKTFPVCRHVGHARQRSCMRRGGNRKP